MSRIAANLELRDAEDVSRLRKKPIASWSGVEPRLVPEVWPAVSPTFQVPQGGTIFTVGSCFARNIEEHLGHLGYHIPMRGFSSPHYEYGGAGILNKYTPVAILQEIEWADRVRTDGGTVTWDHVAPLAFDCGNDAFVDLQLYGYVPVPRSRFMERRQQIYDVFAHAFTADCVVITLGLIEVWYDSETDLFIQSAPTHSHLARARGRFKFAQLDFATSLMAVQQTIDCIRKVKSGLPVMITTSPVPLDRTFTEDDIITANSYSKSLLRTVCGEIVRNNTLVDYFPSYENVMLTRDWSVFEADRRHVREGFVGKIVARLTDTYLQSALKLAKQTQAALAAVRMGEFANALVLFEGIPENHVADGVVAARAHALQKTGRIAEAVALVERTLEARSEDPALQKLLLNLVREQNPEPGRALDGVAAIARRFPDNATISLAHADLLIATGQLKSAIAVIESACDAHPSDATLAQTRLKLLLEEHGLETALAAAATAADRFANSEDIYCEYAQLLWKARRANDTISVLGRFVAKRPNSFKILVKKSRYLQKMSRVDEAVEDIRAALRIRPVSKGARKQLAELTGAADEV